MRPIRRGYKKWEGKREEDSLFSIISSNVLREGCAQRGNDVSAHVSTTKMNCSEVERGILRLCAQALSSPVTRRHRAFLAHFQIILGHSHSSYTRHDLTTHSTLQLHCFIPNSASQRATHGRETMTAYDRRQVRWIWLPRPKKRSRIMSASMARFCSI